MHSQPIQPHISLEKDSVTHMDQHVFQDNSDLASQHSVDMDVETDDHDNSSSSDSSEDPFVQLLQIRHSIKDA